MTIKKIVIVGGGAVGWSVAALLRAQFPRELVVIQLIEDSRKDALSVECASSRIHSFHDLIGLQEKICMLDPYTHFGLGVMYEGWSYDSQKYMLAGGYYGASLDGVDFQNIYIKNYLSGEKNDLDDFSLNAVAAKLGRFGHPSSDSQSIYSAIKYGLHFQLDSYADILKSHALALGIDVIIADCTAVSRDNNSGNITSLELDSQHSVMADLYIDCTGEASVLLGDACGVKCASDDMDILCDRVAIGYRLQSSLLPSIAVLTSTADGFFKVIPLKDRDVIVYYFSSDLIRENDIETMLATWGFTHVTIANYRSYRREKFWVNNCLAIGHSGARYCDLLVSPLQSVRDSIVRFLDLFIDFDNVDASRDEFNRLSHIELDNINEVIELHMYASQHHSAVSCRYFSSHSLSSSSAHRLNLFVSNGRHTHCDLSLLTDIEWAAFFIGNKIIPKSYSYDVDFLDGERVRDFLSKLKAVIFESAQKIPKHADYIKSLLK